VRLCVRDEVRLASWGQVFWEARKVIGIVIPTVFCVCVLFSHFETEIITPFDCAFEFGRGIGLILCFWFFPPLILW
jgi:hypothetical protein